MRKGNQKMLNIYNAQHISFPGKNISHTYKGKHASSCRTRDASFILQSTTCQAIDSGKCYRQKANIVNTNKKFMAITEVKSRKGLEISDLRSILHFFRTNTTDTHFDSYTENNCVLNIKIMDVRNELFILDTTKGAHLMDLCDDPVFILVPRSIIIERIGSRLKDYKCLEKILDG
jgi:hypothetical protein